MIEGYEHCFLAVKVALDVFKQIQYQVEWTIAFAACCLDVVDEFGKFVGIDWLATVLTALRSMTIIIYTRDTIGYRKLRLVDRSSSYFNSEISSLCLNSLNSSTTLGHIPSRCCCYPMGLCWRLSVLFNSNRAFSYMVFISLFFNNFFIKVFDEAFVLPDDIVQFLILLPQFLSIFVNYLSLVLQDLNGFLSHALVTTQMRVQLLLV